MSMPTISGWCILIIVAGMVALVLGMLAPVVSIAAHAAKDYSAAQTTYNGHDYILFHSASISGVVHDPDCPCHTRRPK